MAVEQLPLGVLPTDQHFGREAVLHRAPLGSRQDRDRPRHYGPVWMRPYNYPPTERRGAPGQQEMYGIIVACLDPRDEYLLNEAALYAYKKMEE